MFTSDEIDAIFVGARHVRRLRDPKLQQAAETVLAKVAAVGSRPEPPRDRRRSAAARFLPTHRKAARGGSSEVRPGPG
jgi:predicted DNA-binding transcriptional regulator YafY